jgi:hypothetical protein
MTPTMNFNLDVLSNGRLPLTIDQKYVGSVSSLRKLVWWKQSFCSKSCTSTRWSERVTLRHFDYYFLCRPSRGVLQRSIQRKCSSNEVQLSQKMKRMTSITYCVPIICVISAKKSWMTLEMPAVPSFVLLPTLHPLISGLSISDTAKPSFLASSLADPSDYSWPLYM